MGINYQRHRVAVVIAKGFRQLQKADAAFNKGNVDSSVNHMNKGMNLFYMAEDHAAKAEYDAYNRVGKEINKGNDELNKCFNAYANGNDGSAENHYASAMDDYDRALNLIG